MWNTTDNLGYRMRNRIEANRLMSDEEIMKLPKTLKDIDIILENQIRWRSIPEYDEELRKLRDEERRLSFKRDQIQSSLVASFQKMRRESEPEQEHEPPCRGEVVDGGGGGGGWDGVEEAAEVAVRETEVETVNEEEEEEGVEKREEGEGGERVGTGRNCCFMCGIN